MIVREAFASSALIWGFIEHTGDDGLVFACEPDFTEIVFSPCNHNSNMYRIARNYVMRDAFEPYRGDLVVLGTAIKNAYVKFKLGVGDDGS